MNCDETRTLLAAFVLDSLDAEERAGVEEHVAACADCRGLLEAYEAAVHSLPEALAVASPLRLPPELKSRLLEQIEMGAEAPRPATPRPRRRRRLYAAALAGTALLVAALTSTAVLGVALARERDLRSKLDGLLGKQEVVLDIVDSSRTSRAFLRPAVPGSSAYGKVFTNPDFRSVVFLAARLPQPPPGRAYHVWLTRAGETRLVGVLRVNEEGFGLLVFDAGRKGPRYSAARIYLEERGSTQPRGPLVLSWHA